MTIRRNAYSGSMVLDSPGSLTAFSTGNVVFAVGGPGGLHKTSVYPAVHTGGIGMALEGRGNGSGAP